MRVLYLLIIVLIIVFPAKGYDSAQFCTASGPNWTLFNQPNIQGGGKNTVGGCTTGQTILTVDTNNDIDDSSATTASGLLSNKGTDGKISLREALTVSGVRLINFSISGNIQLTGVEIEILNGNFTLDGGGGPNMGVAILGGNISARASEMIFRNIRLRMTIYPDPIDLDNVRVNATSQIQNIVFDHCSISDADDGNLDINAHVRNMTVQYCIIAWNHGPGHMLVAIGSDICDGTFQAKLPQDITVIYNIFHQSMRNPEFNGGSLFWAYNTHYRNRGNDFPSGFIALSVIVAFEGPPRANFYRNTYIAGGTEQILGEPLNRGRSIKFAESSVCTYQYSIWVSDNIGPSTPSIDDPDANTVEIDGAVVGIATLAGSMYALTEIDMSDTPAQAHSKTMAGAGASLCRDALDTQIINEINTLGGANWDSSESNTPTLPNLNQPCANITTCKWNSSPACSSN